MPDNEVVIIDAAGNEHVFPPGFDPKKAAAKVREQTAGPREPFDSRQLVPPIARPFVDVAAGAVKGLIESGKIGGPVLRKIPGVNALDQFMTPREVNTESANTMESVGKFLEKGAEYAAPLSRVSKLVAGASLPIRMAAEGLAGAGVGAAQSGGDMAQTGTAGVLSALLPPVAVVGSGALNAVRRAAAGAKEGGLGGAIAAGVRKTMPTAPAGMLMQAIKPRNVRTRFMGSLDKAMPEIKAAEQAMGKPIEGIDDLLAATKAAKANIQSQLNQMRGPLQEMGATVDLSPVADATIESIPSRVRLLNKGQAKALEKQAEAFRRPFQLDEAETLLQETNAQLEGFYAQFPGGQRKALAANPGISALEAQAKALRDAIYKRLDDPGQGAAARELNRRYGSLMEIEGEALRRSNVAARQQPESLSEQIGAVRAAADMARGTWRVLHGDLSGAADIAAAHAGRSTAKAIKESQTSDALIRRAFQNFDRLPEAVQMPVRPQTRGLLGPGPRITPPPQDPSFVRSVPAMPAQSERLGLPAGRPPVVTPPAADPSYVRGVPGEYARHEVRGLLPEAQAPRRVFEMPGEVAPDPSSVGSVRAAPIDYAIDPTVAVKPGGFRVAQFSGDPKAARAAVASPIVRQKLNQMLEDLKTFVPQRGKIVDEYRLGGAANESHYAAGVTGSPVGDDIRVISEQNVGNDKIVKAIKELLAGKMPSNRLHTASLDAAMGYLEKRSGYRGPSVPSSDEDAAFEAFSKLVDELSDK